MSLCLSCLHTQRMDVDEDSNQTLDLDRTCKYGLYIKGGFWANEMSGCPGVVDKPCECWRDD